MYRSRVPSLGGGPVGVGGGPVGGGLGGAGDGEATRVGGGAVEPGAVGEAGGEVGAALLVDGPEHPETSSNATSRAPEAGLRIPTSWRVGRGRLKPCVGVSTVDQS